MDILGVMVGKWSILVPPSTQGKPTSGTRWPRAWKVIYLIGGLAGHWEGNLVAWLATGKVIYLIGSLAGQLTCCIGDSGCQKIDILMPLVSLNHRKCVVNNRFS